MPSHTSRHYKIQQKWVISAKFDNNDEPQTFRTLGKRKTFPLTPTKGKRTSKGVFRETHVQYFVDRLKKT